MITNIILVVILLLIAGGAGLYLYKAKRKGEHCIGCPYAKQCGSKSCNCSSSTEHTSKQ
ncbi:MAG: FeoB-associated Cys-rich membrane protein [Clostridia bacterium]|nr:FeoB-associated Cys-rich membrane protein [Clostridia bacterium]